MVQSAGQNWRCFLQGQAMSTTQWRNILVMQPVTVHSAEVLRLLAVYAAAFMLGWAALILMSAILAVLLYARLNRRKRSRSAFWRLPAMN